MRKTRPIDAATAIVANSVMTVGLLPAYGRGIDDNVFAVGGMTADWNAKIKLTWTNINSDAMRPAKTKEVGAGTPNLPHVDGRYAKFADHVDDFIAGFEAYAKFLSAREQGTQRRADCSTASPACPCARSFAPRASITCCCSA